MSHIHNNTNQNRQLINLTMFLLNLVQIVYTPKYNSNLLNINQIQYRQNTRITHQKRYTANQPNYIILKSRLKVHPSYNSPILYNFLIQIHPRIKLQSHIQHQKYPYQKRSHLLSKQPPSTS